MRAHGPEVYKKIMAAERAALYATPERVAEIERRQPEALESGRALFYRPGTVTGKVKGRRPVEEEPEIMVPAWRKTFEFTGDEGALAEEGDTVDGGEVAEEGRDK